MYAARLNQFTVVNPLGASNVPAHLINRLRVPEEGQGL